MATPFRARMIEHRDLGAARDGKSSEILQIPVSRVENKFPVTSPHRRSAKATTEQREKCFSPAEVCLFEKRKCSCYRKSVFFVRKNSFVRAFFGRQEDCFNRGDWV